MRVSCVTACLLAGVVFLFVPTIRGDEASSPEAAWAISLARCGGVSGETTVTVHFPEAVEHAPLTFGIPLAQVPSPRHIALFDEAGGPVAADFTLLGVRDHQPARWTLVSCVVDSETAGEARDFTLRWGGKATPAETALHMETDGDRVHVSDSGYALTVSPRGIEALEANSAEVGILRWTPQFVPKGGEALGPVGGEVRILRDGAVHKAVRFSSALSDAVGLHQEFSFYAGSPFVRCDVRFINRSTKDVPLDGIVPVSVKLEGATQARVGLQGNAAFETPRFAITQKAFGWSAEGAEGSEDNLGEWVSLPVSGAGIMLVFPYFQEMAAGDDDLCSVLEFEDNALTLTHYAPIADTADVRLRETTARTFTYWLVVGTPPGGETALARAVKAMPYVAYDRAYLTRMGVFEERSVSHLFDAELLEAALYFKRAQVPRTEYVRCSRGADPGPDKSGEGFYEVDLHAGGMVFGETFQYFRPQPDENTITRYHEEIGIPREHILTGGSCTYRNGDIVLALFQQYLRTGNRALHDFARIHAQVFADVSVSHAPVSSGLGHYYCNWYSNPYVYQRFEGLLLGALVTGDPWWFETAQAMADYCVRAWKDGEPRDGGLTGGLGGIQYRSPYIAKMLLRLYEVSGEQQYAETAIRLAKWIMAKQEPEGWWRDTPGATREYRNSPIFAGYTCMGLWRLYEATRNEALGKTLMKAVDYHVGMQEDAGGHNPGTFPNSYWYASNIKKDDPVEGNYATTSHWADVILRGFLLTGDQKYFYSANAAWVGVVNHQTPEGGVPLSNSLTGSVWGHVMVESLAAFAAVAEERGLPIVLGSKTGVPGTSFMGKGATYGDGVFSFELKYKHDKPVPVRVFFPTGKPADVTVDGASVPFTYDAAQRTVRFEMPATAEFHRVRVAVRAP